MRSGFGVIGDDAEVLELGERELVKGELAEAWVIVSDVESDEMHYVLRRWV